MSTAAPAAATFADGPVGRLEYAVDLPPAGSAPVGAALLCHPHPQHGGTMTNKVITTVARALAQQRALAVVRFNVRGTGASQGAWDGGRGELDDGDAVAQQCGALAARAAGLAQPLALACVGGFSFGGYVASHVAARRRAAQQPVPVTLLIAPAVVNFAMAAPAPDSIVVMGDHDEVVAPQAVAAWATSQGLSVDWIAGAGHFFHGRLVDLKERVLAHWPPSAAAG